MTSPLSPGQKPGTPPQGSRGPALPTPPKGWPIGSYPTYAEAQRAVDYLSDQQFPVEQVTSLLADSDGAIYAVTGNVEKVYRVGPERTHDWVKIKREREEDFVVTGWIDGKGVS